MIDLTFHKYPKIHQLGHEDIKDIFSNPEDIIRIEEKVDGANFRFMLKEGKLLFGSRTQGLGYEDVEIGGNWKRCIEYIKKNINRKELNNLPPIIICGECMVQHSIAYDWERVPPFLGFDIMDLTSGQFIPNKDVIFEKLNLPTVKTINHHIKVKDLPKEFNDNIVPPSAYYPGQAEGVVFKNYSKQLFGKYVTSKFKEVNKATFGGTKKFAENDDERIVAQYCTNPRIDKCIFKLVDMGEKLDLTLMHKLPEMVLQDIYEENWKEICWSQWSINFKNVKKKVSQRCLAVLRQIMANNSLK